MITFGIAKLERAASGTLLDVLIMPSYENVLERRNSIVRADKPNVG
jgi:hypothetical protein